MSVFVDTSVWSLAFGRDAPSLSGKVRALRHMLEVGETVATGLVLQELLQGVSGPRARHQIVDRFSAIPLLVPDRRDHIEAAELKNLCRRGGIQIGTIDALLAQLCVRHDLVMLTADHDFQNIAAKSPLKLWEP